MPKKLRVLMLDESEAVSASVVRHLERGGFEVAGKCVEGVPQWLVALNNAHWDLAVCISPSSSDQRLTAVRCARHSQADLPVVVLAHRLHPDEMLAALQAGACDWIDPDDLTRLVPIVQRELCRLRTAQQPMVDDVGLKLLHRITGELGQARETQSAVDLVLRHVCQSHGWSVGQAWSLDPDQGTFRCLPVWHTSLNRLEEFRSDSQALRFAPGAAWPSKLWTDHQPVWVLDLTTALECPLSASASRAGLHSALLVPVVVQDQAVSVLAFFAQERRSENASVTLALTVLARQAACLVQHKEVEETLRTGEELFRKLSEYSPFGILLLDEQGKCRYSNPRAQVILGVTTEGSHEHGWLRGLVPEDREPTLAGWLSTVSQNAESACELRLERNQRPAWIRLRATAIAPGSPGGRGFVVAVEDITEKKQFDTEFLQARKMETVGRLAGGVAHDFNNLLTAINSFARLAQDGLPEDSPARNDITMILKAAEKATHLTRRLLAFARREVAVPQILNPNTLLLDLEKMLRRLIREDIELVVRAGPDPWPIQIDPNQFEQVLINLVVNARDAMPKGGTLQIETGNTELRLATAFPDSAVKNGDYVLLAVHDTGVGMTEEVKARIFEPFFTTKQQGKGTGLGLATVYGIVKQNGGHIEVLSRLNQGTTFNIYFPRAGDSRNTPRPQDLSANSDLTGTETVFVVEDESDVRRLTERILRSKGYHVVTASNGEEAMRYAEQSSALPIHLLLTDMVMPKMGGRALAERLRSQRPGLKILYMSGYTQELLDIQKVVAPSSDFIHKPFTPQSLLEQVRALLDAKS